MLILGFFEKVKSEKKISEGFLVIVDPKKSPKKISAVFGTGCQKVSTWSLNGANNDNVNPNGQHFVKCSDIINIGPQAYNTARK